MRELSCAFYGEGNTDYAFLVPLLQRIIQDLLPYVEVVQPYSIPKIRGQSAAESILQIARQYCGYAFIIVHLDADAPSADRAYKERFKPGFDRVQAESQLVNKNLIPVIPVRHIEAWLLVDYEAFRQRTHTQLSSQQLNFPVQPHQVEHLDAKTLFVNIVRASRPKNKPIIPNSLYAPLGQTIDLALLRRIPAYQNFEAQLVALLTQLGYRDDG